MKRRTVNGAFSRCNTHGNTSRRTSRGQRQASMAKRKENSHSRAPMCPISFGCMETYFHDARAPRCRWQRYRHGRAGHSRRLLQCKYGSVEHVVVRSHFSRRASIQSAPCSIFRAGRYRLISSTPVSSDFKAGQTATTRQ